ncbi:MAG: lipoyl(octanoyl) transferase LipB [Pelagibacteraceae bacterium]|nr:lipoyl(octanoyl) transferase LipB [Pelagibacteraceae bacterium]|tara:strand:+ start:675 stop:1292 length:618 start_codon:yes stop_codon:yes gene_type:complete
MKLEIKISKKPVPYDEAIELLEKRVIKIQANKENNLLWILQHPNLYTGGTSAKDHDLLDPSKFPIYKTSRGGQWTFHGNGQKVVYFVHMLKDKNIKKFVRNVENWIIKILDDYNVTGFNDPKNVGIWVNKNNKICKIAAIGIRVKRWIAFHGFSLNINVNKKNYEGIIPCGIKDKGIANICDFLENSEIKNLDENIIKNYKKIFE